LNKGAVRRSYSLDEVREIALEYRNTCMYGHSHKLTRFELQAELRKIDEKHGLDYKDRALVSNSKGSWFESINNSF